MAGVASTDEFLLESVENLQDTYFVPISIGNLFYSRARMNAIRDRLLSGADASLVLICDTLRSLAYLGRPNMTEDEAHRKATFEADEIERMIRKAGFDDLETCKIERMSSFYEHDEYRAFCERLSAFVESRPAIGAEADRLTKFYLHKFYKEIGLSDVGACVQKKNVIHALCISLYCTEIIGYKTELYKQEEGMIQPFVYGHFAHDLALFLGKPKVEREFIELAPLLA